jgi:hypothetical protein
LFGEAKSILPAGFQTAAMQLDTNYVTSVIPEVYNYLNSCISFPRWIMWIWEVMFSCNHTAYQICILFGIFWMVYLPSVADKVRECKMFYSSGNN